MIDHCHFLQSIIISLRSLFSAAKIAQIYWINVKKKKQNEQVRERATEVEKNRRKMAISK